MIDGLFLFDNQHGHEPASEQLYTTVRAAAHCVAATILCRMASSRTTTAPGQMAEKVLHIQLITNRINDNFEQITESLTSQRSCVLICSG